MSDAVLESALRDLGGHLSWPEAPDLVPAVRDEIGRGAVVRTLPRRPVRRAVVLAAAALMVVLSGMVALSPGLRAAILRLFSLPGVRIEVLESAPPPAVGRPSPDVQPFLGRRASVAEARREVGFPVAVPGALDEPDDVYLLGAGKSALVTLAFGERPGLPVDEGTGYSALLTELRGMPTEGLIKKVTDVAQVIPVTVNGRPGYFVQGPHEVFVEVPGRGPILVEPRLAGNTLLWVRGEVTLRLEADVPLGRALEIARTVR